MTTPEPSLAEARRLLARLRFNLAVFVLWLCFIINSRAIPAPLVRWAAEAALEKREQRP